MTRPVIAALVALVIVAGCTGAGGPILANPSAPRPSLPVATPAPPVAVDPQPVVLPRDDGPHDRLTEWWYYTGHLISSDVDGPARRFGFEYVIFRAERGDFPPAWASHLAITDETGAASTTPSARRSAPGSIARRATPRASRPGSTWPSPAWTRPTRRRMAARPGRWPAPVKARDWWPRRIRPKRRPRASPVWGWT
jgi:predicted secreted hydrolase